MSKFKFSRQSAKAAWELLASFIREESRGTFRAMGEPELRLAVILAVIGQVVVERLVGDQRAQPLLTESNVNFVTSGSAQPATDVALVVGDVISMLEVIRRNHNEAVRAFIDELERVAGRLGLSVKEALKNPSARAAIFVATSSQQAWVLEAKSYMARRAGIQLSDLPYHETGGSLEQQLLATHRDLADLIADQVLRDRLAKICQCLVDRGLQIWRN